MLVKQLIEILKKYDGELEVRLADWQEQVSAPIVLQEKDISIEVDSSDESFLKLGNDGE